ncbi:piggyBac transposable element-derived protein 4-like, partial [Vespula squamosa]
SDTNDKYVINGFPNLRKEEIRASSIRSKRRNPSFVNTFGVFVVFELVEPFTRCWKHIILLTKIIVLTKRTTLFRTIRSNRRKLPKLVKSTKNELKLISQQYFISRIIVP